MDGYFENGRAYLNLSIFGVIEATKIDVKAHLDTGYDGFITLPFQIAFPLGLVLSGIQSYTLADGTTGNNLVCIGNVIIEGYNVLIPMDIHEGPNILVGIQLLSKIGKNLHIDFNAQTVHLDPIVPNTIEETPSDNSVKTKKK